MTSSIQSQPSQPPAAPSSTTIPNLRDRIPKLEPRRRRNHQTDNPTPVPATPSLPSPPDTPSSSSSSSSWTFRPPTRKILSGQDHDIFLKSPTADLIKAWVFGLADSVVHTRCSDVRPENLSAPVRTILSILDEAETLVSLSPPDEQAGSRFGNKSFRGFLDLVRQRSPAWHRTLGVQRDDAIAEISVYLDHSFGNRDRIDYGSGHELNFIMWLLCLYQVGILNRDTDLQPIALRIFPRYLAVMRIVQMSYYLEPAGSHGVWGLDDYQFLPFLFGASQLLDHPYITPRAIHQDLELEEAADDYLYLGQVAFVNSTKTVKGLRWHSPMLDDISSARSWAKIDAGMRRMFVAEVLGKLPVMQHFLFGSLIPAAEGMGEGAAALDAEGEEHAAAHEGHDHDHDVTGWGDCCGIKVPSSIAAAQEMKKRGHDQPLRRIPFD